MKKQFLVLSALLLSLVPCPAQEAAKPTAKENAEPVAADPFVKEKGPKGASIWFDDSPTTFTNVGVVVQYIDVKRERWQQWLAANNTALDATPLRKEVETWIAAGDARLAETSLVMDRSGQRAKVESVRNLVYPSEFSDDGSGLAFPIATLTRNVGTTTEVDTILDTDGNVDLSFTLERTIYAGENSPRKDAGVNDGDLRYPVFETVKAPASLKLEQQSWALVGCEKAFENGGTHQTLVFVRPLVHRFEEGSGKEKSGQQGMLTFSWLEVSHETLNGSLMKLTDPSSWIGGGLHDEMRKAGARVLEERSHQFRDGQRGKNESIREMIVGTEWAPAEEGVFAIHTAAEALNVGTTVEADPVLNPNGTVLDLNLAPKVTSFAGRDVFHRVLVDGEWKPNVTMDSVYTMQQMTQLFLPLNIPVLVAVMSPPNGEGWADPSRKVLLFVKFSR
jgi:hypothetical protein